MRPSAVYSTSAAGGLSRSPNPVVTKREATASSKQAILIGIGCSDRVTFSIDQLPTSERLRVQHRILAVHCDPNLPFFTNSISRSGGPIREENAHDWPAVYDTFVKREEAFTM